MRNEHWTDDPELVELFASGNMRPERKRDLEAHLGQCASCRKTVDREATLREGIRRYGRNTLKQRLRDRLSLTAAPAVPWPHILSAAAVLIIVAGIGIQTRWFQSAEPVLHDSDVGKIDSVQRPELPIAERRAPASRALPPPAESAVEDKEDEVGAVETDMQFRRERGVVEGQPSAGFAKSQSQQMGGVVWLTGIILAEESAAGDRSEKKISAETDQRMKAQQHLSRDASGSKIIASQKPLRMLPPAQQAAIVGMQEVVTAIEEKNPSSSAQKRSEPRWPAQSPVIL